MERLHLPFVMPETLRAPLAAAGTVASQFGVLADFRGADFLFIIISFQIAMLL